MIDLKTYTKLKDAVDAKQREADKASGAFDQAMAQLKKEFGCDSIDEAKEKLAGLESAEEVQRLAFEKKLKEFQEEYADVLGL